MVSWVEFKSLAEALVPSSCPLRAWMDVTTLEIFVVAIELYFLDVTRGE
jgi:hypothetical protein